jgi:hypothetical protein
VVAGGVEEQPAAAVVVAATQTVRGHRLYEVERVQREDTSEIERATRLEGPSRRGACEAAGGDCVGEREVQRGALPDLLSATVMVDAIREVVIQLLTELVHSAQDAFGRLGVLSHREAYGGEVVIVKECGAVGPCQKVERHGEVLAPSVGVVTPGHRVDEIKRGVATDELDRLRP